MHASRARRSEGRGIGRLVGGLLAVALVASGCAADVLPDGVTTQSSETEATWDTFIKIAIVIWVIVWGLIGWVLLRYRRRSDAVPSQQQYFGALEIGYTIVPILIVGFLWFVSWEAEQVVTDLVDDPDVEIVVVGFQWQWQFHYVEHGEVTDDFIVNGAPGEPPEMVLPVGQTVRFRLIANDVIHSFWVPEFLEKRDLIPEIENEIDVEVTETGEWTGRCAEFCGLDHWQMYFTVRAVEEADYNAWIAEQQSELGAAT